MKCAPVKIVRTTIRPSLFPTNCHRKSCAIAGLTLLLGLRPSFCIRFWFRKLNETVLAVDAICLIANVIRICHRCRERCVFCLSLVLFTLFGVLPDGIMSHENEYNVIVL